MIDFIFGVAASIILIASAWVALCGAFYATIELIDWYQRGRTDLISRADLDRLRKIGGSGGVSAGVREVLSEYQHGRSS